MNKKLIISIFVSFTVLFLIVFRNPAYAGCFINEGPSRQCYPPLTGNDCDCLLCYTQSAVGSCNYNGDPNGELMELVGYSCDAGECAGDSCPMCAGACFLSGTKVATPGGEKAIEKVKVGDKVLSFDPITQKLKINTVADNFVKDSNSYYIIKTASGKTVKATGEHPFYVGKETPLPTIWGKIGNFFQNISNIFSVKFL
jgi:hypothetical protein